FMLVGVFALFSCQEKEENTPVKITINEGWEFSQAGEEDWMPARVPGTVHQDLMNNDEIEDPHYRMNEDDVQWVEDEDWVYRTTFQADSAVLESDVVELQFEGLDTYADVYVNDELVLEANNMFRGWDVNVKEHLQKGENNLRVYFHSPVKEGMKKLEALDYPIPATNEQAPEGERTSVFTRKAPFHYGWDWGPRLVTSGIWRPVTLKGWDQALIENVYVVTDEASNEKAALSGHVTVNAENAGTYQVSLDIEGDEDASVDREVELESGSNKVPFEFEMDDPDLWWTNGLGEPHLYDFEFSLASGNQVLDRHALEYGVRTLELVQEPDDEGRSFHFELNGTPVFMKGANTIPPETLTPEAGKDRYQRLINNAVAANMNMLRVWGGAIYAEDDFYDLCNRNGILVWQDFMFACALQPGDDAHLENIRKEAEYNVKRLRNNPSLAMWCGNNENYHGWHEWDWQDLYDEEEKEIVWNAYEDIFHDLLPETVENLDPSRSYWPSSPMAYGKEKADRKSGDEHDWTIWFGQEPFSAYGEDVPRFVSEYGLQSFPSMYTIRQFTEEQDRDWNTKVMRHRQRGNMPYVEPGFDGNDMIRWYMAQYYNVPGDFEDFVYVSQLLQAKAYKTALEAHRRNMPHCMGSLYWQLNDSWPTISWSTVDYYGKWKASHYAVRDANEQVILSPVEEDGEVKVYAVSDKLSSFDGELTVKVIDFQGEEIFSETEDVNVEANNSDVIYNRSVAEVTGGADRGTVVAVVELRSNREKIADNLLYFERPKNLDLPKENLGMGAKKTEDGYELNANTDRIAKNVYLETPDGSGHFSDNFFDLLPGERKVIELKVDEDIDPRDIKIKTLNDLKN
ncbi:MAG: glycoside hydrolase family 2 protein, partial [Bacteroidota bacterium]